MMLLSQTQEEQQNWLIYRGHPVLSSQAFRWGVQASKGSLLPCQVFQSKQRQAMHYLSPIGQRQKAFLEGRNDGCGFVNTAWGHHSAAAVEGTGRPGWWPRPSARLSIADHNTVGASGASDELLCLPEQEE